MADSTVVIDPLNKFPQEGLRADFLISAAIADNSCFLYFKYDTIVDSITYSINTAATASGVHSWENGATPNAASGNVLGTAAAADLSADAVYSVTIDTAKNLCPAGTCLVCDVTTAEIAFRGGINIRFRERRNL